jgi:hypothetical protein
LLAFQLVNKPEGPPFTLSWPENSNPPDYRFVRVSVEDRSAVLKLSKREGASGGDLWVSGEYLKPMIGKPVGYCKASEFSYHIHRLCHDGYQGLTLLGSAIAIATVAINNLLPPETVLPSGITPAKYALAVVGIAGAIVAFLGFMSQADR